MRADVGDPTRALLMLLVLPPTALLAPVTACRVASSLRLAATAPVAEEASPADGDCD